MPGALPGVPRAPKLSPSMNMPWTMAARNSIVMSRSRTGAPASRSPARPASVSRRSAGVDFAHGRREPRRAATRVAMACMSSSPASTPYCCCSSRAPVGLVTLISVT